MIDKGISKLTVATSEEGNHAAKGKNVMKAMYLTCSFAKQNKIS